MIWILALIATPGVMFSFVMSLHYTHLMLPRFAAMRERTYLSHQTLFVDVAMAVAVVAVMMVWTLAHARSPGREGARRAAGDARAAGARPLAGDHRLHRAVHDRNLRPDRRRVSPLFSRSPTEFLNAPRLSPGTSPAPAWVRRLCSLRS